MFDYEKLFEPFTGNGATLEGSINWLKKTADVDDLIVDQVVSDTMNLLSHGEKFPLPCPCGCDLKHVNVPIEHYMLSKALDLKKKTKAAFIKVIEINEKNRLQARMKLLSNFDKEYERMLRGSWSDRNLPTFKKIFRRIGGIRLYGNRKLWGLSNAYTVKH